MITANCEWCGKEFHPKKYDYDRGGGRFCSLSCMGKSRRDGTWKPNWRGGKEKRECPTCGKVFFDWPSQPKKYCSRECYTKTRRGRPRPEGNYREKRWIELECGWCGKVFKIEYKNRKGRKYCSLECSKKGIGRDCSGENNHMWAERVEWECKWCGAISEGTPYEAKTREFCSPDCARAWLIDNGIWGSLPVEPEERECEQCGDLFEVPRPSVRKRFCSAACRYGFLSGENNPMWQGGTSFEPYGPEFTESLKDSVRDRDDYLCRLCGAEEEGQHHDVHHIDYDKKNNNPTNLITLCRSCHGRTVHKNSKSRKRWRVLFSEMMKDIEN